ncbi:hypothetical protein [Paraburkholderia sp. BL10I2N1]|uniref:hypothetical protein n=1 Tax=Paraburkholderia sp. BL10I2N1 TaxID=1938796 RepID=UPI001414DF5B|nr:hypothetical protein [Paraburkholderia sp. BL10I2N1]
MNKTFSIHPQDYEIAAKFNEINAPPRVRRTDDGLDRSPYLTGLSGRLLHFCCTALH